MILSEKVWLDSRNAICQMAPVRYRPREAIGNAHGQRLALSKG